MFPANLLPSFSGLIAQLTVKRGINRLALDVIKD